MNSQTLLIIAMIGIAFLSFVSLILALIQSRMSKKIALILSNVVVNNKISIDDMEMPKSGFDILERMIKEKRLPIEIVYRHTKKHRIIISLRNSESTGEEEIMQMERERVHDIRDNIKWNLRLIDTMTVAIIGSIVMVVVSFIAILIPKSIWDLVA